MKSIIGGLVATILLCGASARADYVPTDASWGGWQVSTGEDIWKGHRHTRYPIWNMFDGDPRTAWVSSGLLGGRGESPGGPHPDLPHLYWVQLTPDKPLHVDTIRIMNGYNKDAVTFQRNARIVRVNVVAADNAMDPGTLLGSFSLKDAMGWREIKIPDRRYKSLRIEVTRLKYGADPDIAISELQLLWHGRNVGPPQPRNWVIYCEGGDGEWPGDELTSLNGNRLALDNVYDTGIQPSPDERYFVGVVFDDTPKTPIETEWVYDLRRRQQVWSRRLAGDGEQEDHFDSRGRLRRVVNYDVSNPDRYPLGEVVWSPPMAK